MNNRLVYWVDKTCAFVAVLGGALLMGVAGMTAISIVGRYFFNHPIHGDVEISKQAMGVVVAAFIPYCILNGGNLKVDFFTQSASQGTQRFLDTVGALSISACMAMFAWRTSAAIADVFDSNEVAGNLDLPIAWVYVGMAPCLWLAVLAAAALAVRTWQQDLPLSDLDTAHSTHRDTALDKQPSPATSALSHPKVPQ